MLNTNVIPSIIYEEKEVQEVIDYKELNSLEKDKLAVIAIRTPYDINVLDVETYLCSYEASVQAFIALAKVLTNQITATGKVPVTLNVK